MKSIFFKYTIYFLLLLCIASTNLNAQENYELSSSQETTQQIGNVVLIALPTATLATSAIIGDTKGAWQFTKGLIVSEAITYALKIGVKKQRPDLSNENSFPSGHTSTTFHSAGFIHRRYGLKYSIPAYLLAGFTAASRIDAKKHDLLDVLTGAVIGLGSNLIFTSEYQQEHLQLTFNSYEENYLLGFTFKF
ncbi:phosphatase PAP2 family protein [Robertkochia solimangrovi]|uniref:phosphatase PAP2 family protein n=1 Tax=Robertkochia solimangrovi TaxID=2213046 RepID=UPI00117E7362|nr:phosphatase PAP2 family protein [Robertkochia solimangrovi]TRZ42951.1 PAP2 family protein [Robertkochia solimangrovi]